jgi:hypothetical protein
MATSPPPTTEPEEAGAPAPAGDCPRCGTPYAPQQEYCLECGLRLPVQRGVVPRLGQAWRSRLPWYPGDWIWPALLGLVIAAGGAAVAIATSHSDTAKRRSVIVATNASVATATEAPTTAPEPPVTTPRPRPRPQTNPGGAPAAPRPAPRPRPVTKPAPAPAPTIVAWPAGKNGYTVVLASLPSSAGIEAARDKARQALAARLPSVGVLDSSKFSSLHPGYYVVFSGVYGTLAEAQRAATSAASRYANAYARQITP